MRRLVLFGLAVGAVGCTPAATQSLVYEEARAMAPPPACIKRVPPRRHHRTLSEEEYWELVFPSFEKSREALPDRALACTGRTVFEDPLFKGATRTSVYPAPVSEGDIMIGSGGDRIRVIWMRTHKDADGREVGPLALVRAKDDFGEVYAVGVYKGKTPRPFFRLERIGFEAVVSVSDDECSRKEYKPGTPCESTQSIYMARKGTLVNLANFATERRAFVSAGEPGSPGIVEYHLTAAPKFGENNITLSESVVATDEGGRQLRHSEIDRIFTLHDIQLKPNEEPLWPRIFPRRDEPLTIADRYAKRPVLPKNPPKPADEVPPLPAKTADPPPAPAP
jgi:hypothetical protein